MVKVNADGETASVTDLTPDCPTHPAFCSPVSPTLAQSKFSPAQGQSRTVPLAGRPPWYWRFGPSRKTVTLSSEKGVQYLPWPSNQERKKGQTR